MSKWSPHSHGEQAVDAPQQLFAQTLPAGFWRYWAGVLMQRSSGPKLLTVSDLATTTLPPRGRQVSDPVIERIIASRYDSRHSDYYRTISSWGHYSTRPIDDARAQALGAMSASTFLLDDLFDGWETVEAGLDASEVVASQERMVDALGRRPSIEPPGSPEERDVIDAVRRASDLCHAVRPNDVWWDDYVREASGYVYGRGISSFL
ncbi:MAG: hypothetical protein KDK70_32035, partial [Myxococcales bacterium]|nr:hypothetical protein [Myxococcales bacterium]